MVQHLGIMQPARVGVTVLPSASKKCLLLFTWLMCVQLLLSECLVLGQQFQEDKSWTNLLKIMGSSKSLNKQKNNQQTIEKKNKNQTKLLHGPWMESAPSLSREGLELLNVQDRDAFSLPHCMLALVIWEAAAAKQQPLPNTVVPASHCRDRGSWQTGEPGLMCSACKVCPKPGTELYTLALRRAA